MPQRCANPEEVDQHGESACTTARHALLHVDEGLLCSFDVESGELDGFKFTFVTILGRCEAEAHEVPRDTESRDIAPDTVSCLPSHRLVLLFPRRNLCAHSSLNVFESKSRREATDQEMIGALTSRKMDGDYRGYQSSPVSGPLVRAACCPLQIFPPSSVHARHQKHLSSSGAA